MLLIVERGPGVSSQPLEKLGWRASDTALISFEDVFVPEVQRIGREGAGFYLIMANFAWERLITAHLAGGDAIREVTIAKLATQRAAFEVIDSCLQIHGHAGYLAENQVERAARDARLGPIGGGRTRS